MTAAQPGVTVPVRVRAFEPSDEKRSQGDGRYRDHPMLNVDAENNPVFRQPVVDLIVHRGSG